MTIGTMLALFLFSDSWDGFEWAWTPHLFKWDLSLHSENVSNHSATTKRYSKHSIMQFYVEEFAPTFLLAIYENTRCPKRGSKEFLHTQRVSNKVYHVSILKDLLKILNTSNELSFELLPNKGRPPWNKFSSPLKIGPQHPRKKNHENFIFQAVENLRGDLSSKKGRNTWVLYRLCDLLWLYATFRKRHYIA